MDASPEVTCADVERLFVDLAMHDRLRGFRAVQRMCCEALLSDAHSQLQVKASMGSGKTQAMVASILTLQERFKRAGKPLPLCCIVLKQVAVGEVVASACMRGLMNHEVYSSWACEDDFTTWVRSTHEGEDREFLPVDAGTACRIQSDQGEGWEVSLHQGRQKPSADGRVVAAEELLRNSVLKQRVFDFGLKRRRVGVQASDVYRRPTLKKLNELNPPPPGALLRAATIVVSYQNLRNLLGRLGDAAPDLVLLDESHSVANNNESSTWKADASELCERAARVLMFSGTPIASNGNRQFDYLEGFRRNAHRLVWSKYQAQSAGEIVPPYVVTDSLAVILKRLRQGAVRRGVWDRVLELFGDKLCPQSDVPLVVFSLAQVALLHGAYLLRLEGSSPCANVLLMAPKNDVGVVMQKLVHHVLEDADVRREWLLPLMRGLGAQRGLDVEACLAHFSRLLRVSCPNYDKKKRRIFVERMADWEEGHCSLLIATQWPFEGADMPHLHAVALGPCCRYQDNGLDQAAARPCRAAPGKKVGYVLMLKNGPSSSLCQDPSEDGVATGSPRAADAETEAEDALDEAGPDAEEGALDEAGPDAVGVNEALEVEVTGPALASGREGADADEDCKGRSLSFLAAVSRVASCGTLVMCPLLAAEDPTAHRRLCARLNRLRLCEKRRLRLWEELEPYREMQQDVPLALLTLVEYPTRQGSLVVLGLLTPRAIRRSSESHVNVELVQVYEGAPSWETVQADVAPLLDGSRHGFVWRGDQLHCCSGGSAGAESVLLFREQWSGASSGPPVRLCAADELPEGSRTVARVAHKDFFRELAHFPALHKAFLLGGKTSVLTIGAKSHSDATLPFSMSEKAEVRHLFLSLPLDVSLRPAAPRARHQLILERLRSARHLRSEAQSVTYRGEVALLALAPVDGDREHGLVECRPRLGDRQCKYAQVLACGVVGSEGWSLELPELPSSWEIADVDVLRDEFRILERADDERGWVAPMGSENVVSRLHVEVPGSIFTRHAPRRGSEYELECGRFRTASFVLASERVPVGLRVRQNGHCSRNDERATHWFSFPLQWLRETRRLTVRKLEALPPPASARAAVGYDASKFDESKHAGKDKVNRFLASASLPPDGSALLLDDVDPRSGLLRSADALKGLFPPGRILVPNPDEEVGNIARRMGLRYLRSTWLEALDELAKAPAAPLSLAYYDNCDQGGWLESERNLKAVCPLMMLGGVLACTILGRNFRGLDPCERLRHLDQLMRQNGFESLRCSAGNEVMIKYGANRVFVYRKEREFQS